MAKILVIGSGGREHALGWKLKQSPSSPDLFFAPGNGGTEQIGKNVPIGVLEVDKLLAFAKRNKIDLTVVGGEYALVKGIVNAFKKAGLEIFGPTKEAALLETDKAWAVNF